MRVVVMKLKTIKNHISNQDTLRSFMAIQSKIIFFLINFAIFMKGWNLG